MRLIDMTFALVVGFFLVILMLNLAFEQNIKNEIQKYDRKYSKEEIFDIKKEIEEKIVKKGRLENFEVEIKEKEIVKEEGIEKEEYAILKFEVYREIPILKTVKTNIKDVEVKLK